MKKILALFMSVCSMAFFASGVYAFTLGGTDTTDINLSANVEAGYYGGGDGSLYIADTYNPKGNGKVYGTGSAYSKIYYTTTTSNFVSGSNASGLSSVNFSGWSTLGE
ncbi:hypothetical protein [Hippea maritima]|uniref:Uncharacterized protein n=1 Tax=Hippea maritima (strain ATCC 700847 / DSM 10411 / MH2) TaxID=760142 RepID=F2LVC2_HIPMA|nr:hypothetical protein [Hippea maritima]AEA33706.1 hypothetical protein Hipma_0736 [Hippea maritima DSM 10411]